MKPDGIEAPVVPVLASPRRSSDRARIAAVAIIAVVMLAAGIGLAGNGLAGPPEGSSPSASAPAGAVASPEPTPTAGPAKLPSTKLPSPKLPSPTQNTGLGCAPVRLGSAPEIRLSSGSGDPLTQLGLPRPPAPDSTGALPLDWPAVPVGRALATDAAASIELRADQDACIRYVVADYIPGSGEVPAQFPVAFRSLNVGPARSIVPLGSLPSGDWIVRVVAYFSTDVVGQEDATVIERFFRVINSNFPGPVPTPQNSPAAACAPAPADGSPPAILLTGAGPEPVQGTPGSAESPVTPVQLGDLVELRVSGDVCAIGWLVSGTQPDQNNQYDLEREDNPRSDPFLFAQNRWRLHDLPTGLIYLTATIRFSIDTVVTNRWLLDVRGLDVPIARVVAPNRTVTASRATCGASWSFANATGGYEYCATDPVPSPIPTLTVAPGTPIRVEVPGWTIVGWNSTCGRSDTASNPDFPFVTVDGCDLGGRYAPDASASPVRPMFLPRASGPLVRIWLTVSRGDETVSWPVYVTVSTGS